MRLMWPLRMAPTPVLAALACVLLGGAGAAPPARRDYATLETAVDPQGAFECPCATAHVNNATQSLLAAAGLPAATYGLQGCKAYDANLATAEARAVAGCSVRTRKQQTSLPPPAPSHASLAHRPPRWIPAPETRAGVRVWCDSDCCLPNVSPGSCRSASLLQRQVVLH